MHASETIVEQSSPFAFQRGVRWGHPDTIVCSQNSDTCALAPLQYDKPDVNIPHCLLCPTVFHWDRRQVIRTLRANDYPGDPHPFLQQTLQQTQHSRQSWGRAFSIAHTRPWKRRTQNVRANAVQYPFQCRSVITRGILTRMELAVQYYGGIILVSKVSKTNKTVMNTLPKKRSRSLDCK